MPLRLYGVEGSQPVRSVLWLLQMKEIPYELVRVVPGHAKGTRDPAFIVRNPTGTVPFLEDPDTGVALAEGAAILTYLANKHGVTDLYPADPKQRAPVDEYLHWHHSNTRSISGGFFAPVVRQDLKSPPGVVEAHVATANKALKNFESRLGKQARLSPAMYSLRHASCCGLLCVNPAAFAVALKTCMPAVHTMHVHCFFKQRPRARVGVRV
jgi:glutathione S-transferase